MYNYTDLLHRKTRLYNLYLLIQKGCPSLTLSEIAEMLNYDEDIIKFYKWFDPIKNNCNNENSGENPNNININEKKKIKFDFQFGFSNWAPNLGFSVTKKSNDSTDKEKELYNENIYLKNILDKQNNYIAQFMVEIPTDKDIQKITNFFGANEKWIKHGKGSPFSSLKHNDPMDTYKLIKDLTPEKIYFILEKEEKYYMSIILELSDYCYKTIQLNYYLNLDYALYRSNRVSNAESICKLIEDVYNLYRFKSSCINSYMVSSEIFNDLNNGHIYPGAIVCSDILYNKIGVEKCYWAEDFIDLNHSYHISKDYSILYPSWFVPTQKAIKNLREERYKQGIIT